MNTKSRISAGHGHHASSFQQEMEQLFDGFARNLAGHVAGTLAPGMDMNETDEEIEITTRSPALPSQTRKIEIKAVP